MAGVVLMENNHIIKSEHGFQSLSFDKNSKFIKFNDVISKLHLNENCNFFGVMPPTNKNIASLFI